MAAFGGGSEAKQSEFPQINPWRPCSLLPTGPWNAISPHNTLFNFMVFGTLILFGKKPKTSVSVAL